jgi:hypothetical protein
MTERHERTRHLERGGLGKAKTKTFGEVGCQQAPGPGGWHKKKILERMF